MGVRPGEKVRPVEPSAAMSAEEGIAEVIVRSRQLAGLTHGGVMKSWTHYEER